MDLLDNEKQFFNIYSIINNILTISANNIDISINVSFLLNDKESYLLFYYDKMEDLNSDFKKMIAILKSYNE